MAKSAVIMILRQKNISIFALILICEQLLHYTRRNMIVLFESLGKPGKIRITYCLSHFIYTRIG